VILEPNTILILGGYGNTGRALARLLLEETGTHLILAGRNLAKAKASGDELNRSFEGNRVSGAYADASDEQSLKNAFTGVDFVVVASSTTQHTGKIASAALEARIGYLDIQFSPPKVALLKTMEEKIKQAGCCFITDGGFHPGLPAVMVRHAAQFFDRLESARVGSVIKEDWKSLQVDDSTVNELVELINDYEMLIFKGGRWKKVSMLSTADYIRMDFGGVFGKQYCAPMMLEEMRQLPEMYPTLTEVGFYVGSFNWFVDWIIMPIAMMAMKINPKAAINPLGRWTHWGLKTFSKPPFGTLLKVEATGTKDGHPRKLQFTISHRDGYLFTAIPVAACLLQYLDGSIHEPGLWMQAHVVEPTRFMFDMQRMGITADTIIGGKDEMESK
jgi:saccharopine dehydrogenase (NAD+, L-lysine-forming)